MFAARSVPLALAAALLGLTLQARLPSTRAIVDGAVGYVAEYQRQLTAVVADEIYLQAIEAQQPRDPGMPRQRNMRSEVFFMFAPDGRDWMTIRDVMVLDGHALDARPDLRQALQTLPAHTVATRFKEYNSRYNIGRTYRNFNEPTLSLLVLDAEHRHRFSFDRRGVEQTGGASLVTIAFTEKETPPLIRDPRRGPAFAKGEIVVELNGSRVRRARLTAKVGELRLELTTEYAHDERLGMLVPSVFRERYEYGGGASARPLDSEVEHERVLCEARYSNFRRFETSVRVK